MSAADAFVPTDGPAAVTVLGAAGCASGRGALGDHGGGHVHRACHRRSAAHRLLGPSGRRIAGTLGICTIGAVQYTDCDLGPYNEVALAIVVEPHDGSPAGSMASGNLTTLIHRLPVNQEFTCAAGRDIWGFPKWICDITWRQQGARTDVVLVDDNELILALGVKRSPIPVPGNEMEMRCYSWREGVLRLTPWTMRLSGVRMRPGGAEIEVGANHEVADELRSLGFPKPALMSQTVGAPLVHLRRGRGRELTS